MGDEILEKIDARFGNRDAESSRWKSYVARNIEKDAPTPSGKE
jgi:hypothetical protein